MKKLWEIPPIPGISEEVDFLQHKYHCFESAIELIPNDDMHAIYISVFFKGAVKIDTSFLYAISPQQMETGLDCLVDLGDSPELAALNERIPKTYSVKERYFQYRLHFLDAPCYEIIAQDWAVRSSSPRLAQYQKDPGASWIREIRPRTSRDAP